MLPIVRTIQARPVQHRKGAHRSQQDNKQTSPLQPEQTKHQEILQSAIQCMYMWRLSGTQSHY